jgi:ABC-type multidrug transport system permease subunit
VHSLSAGNTSLLSFLTTFKNDTTIPEVWKIVIASIISIVIMAFVGVSLGGGELIAGILGAIMLTFFGIIGWYNWILVTIAWVVLVGYLMWRGGGGW